MNNYHSSSTNKPKFIQFLVKKAFTIALTAFVLSYYFTALTIIAWIVWFVGVIGCFFAIKETQQGKRTLVSCVLLAVAFGNLLLWTMLSIPGIFGGWAVLQFTAIFYSFIF
jgi:hypothetical protein